MTTSPKARTRAAITKSRAPTLRRSPSFSRTWGIEGQPFAWSIGSCRSAPGGLHADVGLPEASTVALLDAAVHVARLVDSSNPRLMFPAAVESVRFAAELADARGSVEVRRRGGNGDELIVDIAVKAPDGSTCVDIRSLRYADVESDPAQSAADDADPRTFAHAIEWQPWDEHADPQQPPDALCTLAVVGENDAARTLRDRLADAGYTVGRRRRGTVCPLPSRARADGRG